MQIIIHNSGDLTEATKNVINEKVQKLETFYDRIERAEVFLKEDDGSAANGHTVEIRLAIPGNDLFANHTDQSIERATADVTEALRRQIKKHKEKISHRNSAPPIIPPMGENDDPERIITSEEQL